MQKVILHRTSLRPVSLGYAVATGYFFPTPLQLLWEKVRGPWASELSAVSRN